MLTKQAIEERYSQHEPELLAKIWIGRIGCGAQNLAEKINQYVPDGKEKDNALEKIDEALMWANVAISRANPEFMTPAQEYAYTPKSQPIEEVITDPKEAEKWTGAYEEAYPGITKETK
jgi:hypothetical protein